MSLERENVDNKTGVKLAVFPVACLIYQADGNCYADFQCGLFLVPPEASVIIDVIHPVFVGAPGMLS